MHRSTARRRRHRFDANAAQDGSESNFLRIGELILIAVDLVDGIEHAVIGPQQVAQCNSTEVGALRPHGFPLVAEPVDCADQCWAARVRWVVVRRQRPNLLRVEQLINWRVESL
jgi:hypothetical protein